MRTLRTVLLISALFATGAALAEPPNDMAYQGLLRDSGGQPLAGPVNLEVGIWDAAVAGSALYRESQTGVALQGGVFHILIGTGSILEGVLDANTFSAPDRYVEVTVNGETLTPRQAISSAPYALQAATAGTAGVVTTIVTGAGVTAGANGGTGIDTATCPAGWKVTGGGMLSGTNGLNTRRNYPPNDSAWEVMMHNSQSSARSFTAYAVCVNSAP